jgi:CelD/BcsL family acetyltransferase involved in cellulose biosynthesis
MTVDLSEAVISLGDPMSAGQAAGTQSEVSAETVTTEEGFSALRTPWNALAQAQPRPHPFFRHEWFMSWWRAFGSGSRLAIRVARRGERVVGIAPLAERRIDYLGLPIRALASLTNDHSSRFDLLLAPGDRAQHAVIIEALWGEVLERPTWDVVLMQHCSADSVPMELVVDAAARRGYRASTWEGSRSPYLHVSPDTPPITSTLTTRRRSDLRRRRGQLDRALGPLRLERVSEPGQLPRALSDMFRIEAAGWKGARATAMASNPATKRFYTEIARDAADRGTLSIDFLTAGDTRVAFGYHLVAGSTWYLLKTGYDSVHARFAPGVLFLFDLFGRLQPTGPIEYDFLGRDEPYKLEWTPLVNRHLWWYLFPPRMKSLALRRLKFEWLPWARRITGRAPAFRGGGAT